MPAAAQPARHPLPAGRARHPEGRDPHARVPGQEPERPGPRRWSSRTAPCWPSPNAILFYLADGTPFLPADRLGRAQVLQWLFFEQYSHEPFIAVARFIHHLLPPDTPAPRRAAPPGAGRPRGPWRHGAAASPTTHSWSPTATRSRTSPSTPTPMSQTRAASISRAYPGVRAWLARVAGPAAASADHCRLGMAAVYQPAITFGGATRAKAAMRVFHPTLDPRLIASALALQPQRSCRVGDRRRIPRAGCCPGTRSSPIAASRSSAAT